MSSDILNWVKKDGSSEYKAENGRYHLYISNGCPFAHRTTIIRVLKGLENVISLDNVDYVLDKSTGWKFSPEKDGCDKDTVCGKEYLKEIYQLSHPEYVGKITVPVLFDKNTMKIVSNSSEDILRMLNSEFNEFCATPEQAALDLYPSNLKKQIDEMNNEITPSIVYGVYRVGFAAAEENQEKYSNEIDNFFGALDKIENILEKQRYLIGDTLTEADIRLFVTLVRFDSVYFSLLKCSKKPLILYKNIWPYLRDIYQTYNIGSTVFMQQIKMLYYASPTFSSPTAVVPIGPELDWQEPHARIPLVH